MSESNQVCKICTSRKRNEIEKAIPQLTRKEIRAKYGIRSEIVKTHLEHTRSASEPAQRMREKAEHWIESSGDLALQAARITVNSRVHKHLGIGYLSRVADFARIAGEAGGLLKASGDTTNVQANVLLMPRDGVENQ